MRDMKTGLLWDNGLLGASGMLSKGLEAGQIHD